MVTATLIFVLNRSFFLELVEVSDIQGFLEVEVMLVEKFSLVVDLQPLICCLECSLDPAAACLL